MLGGLFVADPHLRKHGRVVPRLVVPLVVEGDPLVLHPPNTPHLRHVHLYDAHPHVGGQLILSHEKHLVAGGPCLQAENLPDIVGVVFMVVAKEGYRRFLAPLPGLDVFLDGVTQGIGRPAPRME